jgi:putative ATP-binding cassette transporter
VIFLPLAGSSIVVAVLAVWARMTTQRTWRAWLTRHLIDRWLANDDFRQLRFTLGEKQNPEYRIAEDARVATDAPVTMAAGLLSAVFSAVIFIGILWNLGGDLVISVFGHRRQISICRPTSTKFSGGMLNRSTIRTELRNISVNRRRLARTSQLRLLEQTRASRAPK